MPRKAPPPTPATETLKQPTPAPQGPELDWYEHLADEARRRARYWFSGSSRAGMWTWDDPAEGGSGLWSECGDQRVRAFCQVQRRICPLDKKPKFDTIQKEVIGIMKATLADRLKKMPQPDKLLIPVQNGVFSLKTGEIEPYQADHWFTSKLPYCWEPRPAATQRVLDLFGQWVTEPQMLIELAGYCMLRAYPLQKFFALIGKGRDGKTQYMKLLNALLGGVGMISGVPLHELESEKQQAALYGKLANLAEEMPVKVLNDSGVLKRLTGGSLISSDVKYKDRIEFFNHAKLIFALNTLPPTADRTDSFYRRVDLIEFPNQFLGERDSKDIADDLLIPDLEWMESFFHLALKSLQEAYHRRWTWQHLGKVEIHEARKLYSQLSDSVEFFLTEFCSEDDTSWTIHSTILHGINAIRKTLKLEKLSSHAVTKALQGHGYEQLRKSVAQYESTRVWPGIRLDLLKLQTYLDGISTQEDFRVSPSTMDAWNQCSQIALASLRCIMLGYTDSAQIARFLATDKWAVKAALDELRKQDLVLALGEGYAPSTDPYLLAEIKFLLASN